MKVIKMEEANLKEPLSLAIGFFDGLHLGHMSLINEVLKYKGETKTAVMSFDVHPLCVLKGEKRQSIITLEEKKELIERKFSKWCKEINLALGIKISEVEQGLIISLLFILLRK